MKNNLTITVIFPDNKNDVVDFSKQIKEKLAEVYDTKDIVLLFGLGYSDFIITNKSKGTTYGRFKKHI